MAYPDPSVANDAPRPYGSQSADHSQPDASPFAGHIANAWPATSANGRGYLTLNEYFQLGSANFPIAGQGLDQDSESLIVHELPDQDGADGLTDQHGEDEGETDSPAKATQKRKARGGRRGWKKLLKGTEHADLFKTPRLSRAAGGRDLKPAGPKRGRPKNQVDPGIEFKKLQGRAMEAWMKQDYETAEQCALQAVQVNPEVYDAHALVSDVLLAQGRRFEALFAKHVGAPTARDPEIYIEVAEQWVEMYHEDDNEQCLKWALDSFREALKGQATNCRIRRGMRDIYLILDDRKGAKLMSKSIARFEPGDLENAQRYAELCASDGDLNEISKARDVFEEAFRLHEHDDVTDDLDAQWTYLNIYIDILDRLGLYADAILQLKLKARRCLGRQDEIFWDRFDDDREFDPGNDRRNYVWEFQQGRASLDAAKFGDGLPIEIRVKLGVLRLRVGPDHYTEGQRHLFHLLRLRDEVEDLHDLFVLSATTLKQAGLTDSAVDFYAIARSSTVSLREQELMDLASCYLAMERREDAEDCYLAVVDLDNTHVQARVQLAKLYETMNQRDKAQLFADEVIRLGHTKTLQRERVLMSRGKRRIGPKAVPRARQAPRDKKADKAGPRSSRLLLPKPSATERDMDDAGNEISPADSHVDDGGDVQMGNAEAASSTKHRTTKRTSLKKVSRLQEQRKFIHEQYAALQDLWHSLDDEGEEDDIEEKESALRQWVIHANAMLDEFRSMRAFYPARYRLNQFRGIRGLAEAEAMDEMAALKERMRDAADENDPTAQAEADAARVSNQFHEIPFTEWHRIAFELAVYYSKQVDRENCYDILEEVLMKNTVFRQDAELSNINCALSIYCASLFNDGRALAETARHYILSSNYRSGTAYQLLAALVRLGKGEESAYQDSNLSKFVLRCVRLGDYACMDDDLRKRKEWGNANEAVKLAERLTKQGDYNDGLDAGVLAIQGHILCTNRTARCGPGGIIHPMLYLFRALALQPDNVTLNLSIAVMFLKGALYRTTSNRQHGIAQAMAFFYKYYDLRVADQKACHLQEAQFNLARLWHHLGLTNLAVEGYEKVLALSEAVQQEASASDEYDDAGEDAVEDFAKEAAFALQNVYAHAGNVEAAMAITEEWLVL